MSPTIHVTVQRRWYRPLRVRVELLQTGLSLDFTSQQAAQDWLSVHLTGQVAEWRVA